MLPRTSLIDLLDDACQQAVAAQRTGRRLSALRLPPVMFELVKHEKRETSFSAIRSCCSAYRLSKVPS
jgi:hypothetical protein